MKAVAMILMSIPWSPRLSTRTAWWSNCSWASIPAMSAAYYLIVVLSRNSSQVEPPRTTWVD